MILYLDTSALVKKYVHELGSGIVIESLQRCEDAVISSVGYAEVIATFHRKIRERKDFSQQIEKKIQEFRKDWERLIHIHVNSELNSHIDHVCEKYSLKGFDAIHLSSALLVRNRVKESMTFACFDDILVKAATREDFDVLPIFSIDENPI